MYVTSGPYIDIVVFVVYRLQNRRLRFCHHPPQNHPFLTTRIGIIEDGLLRICRVKPDRLIVVVSLYRIVCYLSIAGAFNVIPGRFCVLWNVFCKSLNFAYLVSGFLNILTNIITGVWCSWLSHSLSMWEVPGSIPVSSNFFIVTIVYNHSPKVTIIPRTTNFFTYWFFVFIGPVLYWITVYSELLVTKLLVSKYFQR